jgi:hypothetical protein
MVRLLSMLMKDPLGYSDSPEYSNLVREGNATADGWYWTKEMLKGNFKSCVICFFNSGK